MESFSSSKIRPTHKYIKSKVDSKSLTSSSKRMMKSKSNLSISSFSSLLSMKKKGSCCSLIKASNNLSSLKQYECGFKGANLFRNDYTKDIPFLKNYDLFFLQDEGKSAKFHRKDRQSDGNTLSPKHLSLFHRRKNKSQEDLLYSWKKSYKDTYRRKTLLETEDRYQNRIISPDHPIKLQKSTSQRVIPLTPLPFYKQIGIRKSQMINQFFSLNKSRNQFRAQSDKLSLNQPTHSYYLQKLTLDKIPLVCPSIASIQNNNFSESQKSRYIGLMNQLLKVQFLISLDESKENDIMKEFLISNGIHNHFDIKAIHLRNLAFFLKGHLKIANIARPVKDIIVDILTNPNYDCCLEKEENEEDTAHQKVPIFYEKPSRTEEYTDINSRMTLDRQKSFFGFFANRNNDMLNKLETEINKALTLKKVNFTKKSQSVFTESHLPISASSLYLTQANELNRVKVQPKGEYFKPVLLNHAKRHRDMMNQHCKRLSPKLKRANVSALNDKFFYSTYDQKRLVDKIKARSKLTELLVFENAKQKIAITKASEYFNKKSVPNKV